MLACAAFIIALGYGFIAPVLPQFASSFNVSMAAAGAVVSVFALARLLGAPGAGALVDKLGSRPIYLTGLTIVAASTFFVAFAQAYWHILVLRFIAGFGSTMFTLSAQALIVRVTHPSLRGRANAIYATSFLLGNIFGPIIGAALSFMGYRAPFAIYGVGVGIAAFLVWALTRAANTRAANAHAANAAHPAGAAGGGDGGASSSKAKPPMRFAEAWKRPTYRALLATAFTNGFVNMGARVAVLPLFAAAVFKHGGAASGFALTAFAAGMAIALQFSGRLADKKGRRPLILAGLACAGTFTGTLGLAQSFWPLIIISVLAGVGGGLMSPAVQASLADIIGNERSGGKVLSTFQMTQDFGQILAPLVLGGVAESAGFAAAFGLCGVVCAAAFIIFLIQGKETMLR